MSLVLFVSGRKWNEFHEKSKFHFLKTFNIFIIYEKYKSKIQNDMMRYGSFF